MIPLSPFITIAEPATMLQRESIATGKVETIFLTIFSLVSGDGNKRMIVACYTVDYSISFWT